MKKLVIFDLDGTILNTITDITNSMNHLLKYLDAPIIEKKDIKVLMNKGRRYVIEKALGKEVTKEEALLHRKIYNEHYFVNKNVHTKPYEGIVELLNKLKNDNYLLAVCSNKLHQPTTELISEIFPNIFDYVIGSSDKFLRKPNKDMIVHILKKLDVINKKAIYIGDTIVDMKAASNAKVYKIAVSYGFGNEDDLLKYSPDAIVDKAEELYQIITNYFSF